MSPFKLYHRLKIRKAELPRGAPRISAASFQIQTPTKPHETGSYHLCLFFSSSQASAGSENEFVSAVVGGIPPTALSRGVYTEQSLRERFTRVETVARRVGAIGDDGGSLLRPVLFAFGDIVLIMLRNLLAQCYSFISITFNDTVPRRLFIPALQ